MISTVSLSREAKNTTLSLLKSADFASVALYIITSIVAFTAASIDAFSSDNEFSSVPSTNVILLQRILKNPLEEDS